MNNQVVKDGRNTVAVHPRLSGQHYFNIAIPADSGDLGTLNSINIDMHTVAVMYQLDRFQPGVGVIPERRSPAGTAVLVVTPVGLVNTL